MADTVTSQVMEDGPRNLVMKFTGVSDGTGESAVAKVDISALAGRWAGGAVPSALRVDKIEYSTSGMGVNMLWDATTDVLIAAVPADRSDTLCFRDVGGIQNNSGTGKTGDIVFTTVGHTSGDTYTIILHMVKKY